MSHTWCGTFCCRRGKMVLQCTKHVSVGVHRINLRFALYCCALVNYKLNIKLIPIMRTPSNSICFSFPFSVYEALLYAFRIHCWQYNHLINTILSSLCRYGWSRARYVYSLISGVGIFFLGAGVTMYHGVTGLISPAPLENLAMVSKWYLTIIPRARVGCDMIDNHLISNKRKWNNCFIKNGTKVLVKSSNSSMTSFSFNFGVKRFSPAVIVSLSSILNVSWRVCLPYL